MVLMIECMAPPPTLLVCWNVFCIPEGCVSVTLRYSFKALSDIESANPHSTVFTTGIESATILYYIHIDNRNHNCASRKILLNLRHPFQHAHTHPGLIKDPVVKPLPLRPINVSTTELVSCEADTTSDYFSASGGSTPSSHSRSQSLVGCELLGCTEDDSDCFSEPSCDSEDEWEQLDRQLQLLEERRGSVPLLPQSSSWHRYVTSLQNSFIAFHDLIINLGYWSSVHTTNINCKQLCTLETVFSL